jgi:hypothetical protein
MVSGAGCWAIPLAHVEIEIELGQLGHMGCSMQK